MKKILLGILVLFVIAQFVRPDKNIQAQPAEPFEFYKETNTSQEVQQILKTSCNDCHSNYTDYPWYSHITPINFFLASHIEDGKKHLNFSEWSSYENERKEHKMEEIEEMVKKKEMPLPSYLIIHKDAELSESQTEALVDWAKEVEKLYK